MKFTPVAGYTRDGRAILIRHARPEDGAALLALKLSYIDGSATIPIYVDEYRNNVQDEAELISRYLAEPNSLLLVAEHEGLLVGNLDITGNRRRMLYHTAMAGMGVHNLWQNNNVGHLLLQNSLAWAKEYSPLTIVWLEVYATNAAGIKLYEKNGFKACGAITDFFGRGIDKITMVYQW